MAACASPPAKHLPLRQDQLRISGHAIEARIYAEDPARDFLPSIGTLVHLRQPTETARRARRYRRAPGRRDHAELRPDDRQADRPGRRPRRGGAAPGRRARAVRGGGRADQSRLCCAPSRRIPPSRAQNWTPASSPATPRRCCPRRRRLPRRHRDAVADDRSGPRRRWPCWRTGGRGTRQTLPSSADPWSPWNVADAWRMNGDGYQDLLLRRGEDVGHLARPSGGGRHLSAGPAVRRVPRRGGRGRRSRHDNCASTACCIGLRVVRRDDELVVILRGRNHVFTWIDPLAPPQREDVGSDLVIAPIPARVARILVEPGAMVRRARRWWCWKR